MNLLWCAEKCRQLTMCVSLQAMSDFADSMQEIASRSRIISSSIQVGVYPSLELAEESPIRLSTVFRTRDERRWDLDESISISSPLIY